MASIRSLYRQLLRHGSRFPSVKRKEMVADMKIEFREHMHETDPAKIAKHIETAQRGLETMMKYTSLDKYAPTWSVKLEEDPLGQTQAEQRRAEEYYRQQQAKKLH